jgi:hypothetical protein
MKNRSNFKLLAMYGEIPYVVNKPGIGPEYYFGTYLVFENKRKGMLVIRKPKGQSYFTVAPIFLNTQVYPVLRSLSELTLSDMAKLTIYNGQVHKRQGDDIYLKTITKKVMKFQHLSMRDMLVLMDLKYDVLAFIQNGTGYNYINKKAQLNANGIYL